MILIKMDLIQENNLYYKKNSSCFKVNNNIFICKKLPTKTKRYLL